MKGLWKGILYALVLAVPAAYLGKLYPIIGGPVFGILLGIICAFIPRGESFNAGINFTGKKILQYSIILLGFEMNLFNVLEVGSQSLYVMIFTLLTSFAVAWWVGRLLKMPEDTKTLIGAGTSICGGSAIAALAPVIGAKDKDIVFSISTIFLFNVLAVFIFPFLGHVIGMSDFGIGIAIAFCLAQTHTIDNRGMVKCIAYYGILLGEQRFEQSTVGIKASCIENGVLSVEIFADGILQLLVEVLGATDEANRRHAVAVVSPSRTRRACFRDTSMAS